MLCGAHHRAEHRGQLVIKGRVATGLVFEHADGTAYGQIGEPRALDVQTRVFQALRGLGFRETDARLALERVRPHHGSTTELEPVLRAALAELAPRYLVRS